MTESGEVLLELPDGADPASLTAHGFASAGEKFQNTLLRFREFGQATLPLKAMAHDTGVAKAETLSEIFAELQPLVEMLHHRKVTIPKNLLQINNCSRG